MEYVFFILLGVAVFVFGYVMIQAKLQRRPHAQPPKEHGAATYAIEKGNQGAQKNHEKGD